MADTFTAHYNLTKPQIGGDPDTWGNLLNANFDAIDAQLFTASTYALPLTGGTLTAALTLAANGNQVVLRKSASGQANTLFATTAGVSRWGLVMGDSVAESGSNAGSNFLLQAYSDAGAFIGNPLTANRSTLQCFFAVRPQFNSATPWDSANFNPANYALLNSSPTFTGALAVTGGNVEASGLADVHMSVQPTTGDKVGLASNNTPNMGIYNYTDLLWLLRFDGAHKGYFSELVSGPDFQSTSDERLKSNIRGLRRGLDELKRMLPREYVKGGKEEIGFLAQEAREVIPEAVSEGDDGILSLSYGQVVALVASAVLDLDARMALAGI
jgi:hypothetical protein